jgi:hypothetical protein
VLLGKQPLQNILFAGNIEGIFVSHLAPDSDKYFRKWRCDNVEYEKRATREWRDYNCDGRDTGGFILHLRAWSSSGISVEWDGRWKGSSGWRSILVRWGSKETPGSPCVPLWELLVVLWQTNWTQRIYKQIKEVEKSNWSKASLGECLIRIIYFTGKGKRWKSKTGIRKARPGHSLWEPTNHLRGSPRHILVLLMCLKIFYYSHTIMKWFKNWLFLLVYVLELTKGLFVGIMLGIISHPWISREAWIKVTSLGSPERSWKLAFEGQTRRSLSFSILWLCSA